MVSLLASVWAGFERAAEAFCAPPRGVLLVEALDNAVVFDFETTGPDPQSDSIVQAAFRRFGRWPARFVGLCWPDNATGTPAIPKGASDVHGITDWDLIEAGAWPVVDLLHHFDEMLAGCERGTESVVAFNGEHFDVPLLRATLARNFERGECRAEYWHLQDVASGAIPCIDPFHVFAYLTRARNEPRWAALPRSLGATWERIFGEPMKGAHDAMADVNATHGLLAATSATVPEVLTSLTARESFLAAQWAARDAFRAENDAFGWWYRVGHHGDLVWQTKKRRGEPVHAVKDWREIDFAARKAGETGEFMGAVDVRDAVKARGVRGNINIKDLI
jgi:hypothetical protein